MMKDVYVCDECGSENIISKWSNWDMYYQCLDCDHVWEEDTMEE